MNDDNTFRSFGKVFEEAYPVVCLPITANDEGIDNGVYFNNLCNKLNELPFINILYFSLCESFGHQRAVFRFSPFNQTFVSQSGDLFVGERTV